MLVVVTLPKDVDDFFIEIRNDPVLIALCSPADNVKKHAFPSVKPSLIRDTDTFHVIEVPATRTLDTWSVRNF